MNKKKIIITIGIASMMTIVSACGSNSDVKEPAVIGEPKAEEKIMDETKKEEVDKVEVEEAENREQAFSFSHIHGMSHHPTDSNKILLASHNGLIEYDKEEKVAYYVGSEKFDLMGYSVIPGSNILMTSGHPGEGSSLPNPLGFLWSEDFGKTWEPRGLHGMIDFHALTSTTDQSKLLGYGSDSNKNVILESKDKGNTWDVLKTKGLPLNHDEFINMAVVPDNGNIVYAATNQGLFYSKNGGVDWNKKLDGYITALYVLGEDEVIFYEANQQGLIRLKGEEYSTYDLYLGNDAVSYISLPDYQEPAKLVVTTFQNNIMESLDHGKTWNEILKNGNFQ